MSEFITEMTVGDMFDRTFKLIGKTFSRNIVIALIFNIPPIVLLFFGGYLALSTASDMVERWQHATPEIADVIQLLVFPLALFFLGALAATVAAVWNTLAAYVVVGNEMHEEPITWQEAISQTGSRVLTGFGFQILMGLAITGIIILPYAILLGGIVTESVGVGIVGGLLLFASFFVVIYLTTRWVFGMLSIGWEDTGVIEAFRRSSVLIKGRWWRTFGILLLFGLVAQFAIGLVASPVAIIGFIGPYIDLLSSVGNNTDPDPQQIVSLVSGMMTGYFLMIAITVILTYVIQPVYMMVVYFDCRARNGEFDSEEPPTPIDPDDAMQLGDNWQNVSV